MKNWLRPIGIILLLLIVCSQLKSQIYLLNQDFSSASGTTPPTGWSNTTVNGQNYDKWHFDNPGNRNILYPFTGKFAIFDGNNYSQSGGPETVNLESPSFDASISNNILLYFDNYFAGGNNGKGIIQVYDGSSWYDVDSIVDSTSSTERKMVNISTKVGGKTNAKIRFQWKGNSSYYWAIDNIQVYAPLALDAGITKVDSPVAPINPGLHSIKISLTNYGADTIKSTTIKWTVNGTTQTSYSWSGSIAIGETQNNINIGNVNFVSGTPVNLKIWQDKPNNLSDPNKLNDTITTTLYSTLCGTYTIGGTHPNFNNFTEAANALNYGGIRCSVTFKVRNGTYNEQISIGNIFGSDSLNHITFESESGDSSKVILQNNVFNTILDYTLIIDGSQYITIKKISIKRGNNNYDLIIKNNAHHITLINNFFSVSSFGNKAIYSPDKSELRNIIIHNNYVSKGIIEARSCTNINITDNYAYSGITTKTDSNCLISNNKGLTGDLKSDYGASVRIENNVLDGNISCNNTNDVVIYNNTVLSGYIRCKYGSEAVIKDNVVGDYIGIIDHTLVGSESKILYNVINSPEEYGIQTSGTNVTQIIGNKITGVDNNIGIDLQSSGTLVANNFVQAGGIGKTRGILINSSAADSRIIFNTINVTGTHKTECRAIEIAGGANLTIKNNIFSNTGDGYGIYIPSGLTGHDFDNNDYYSLKGSFGYYNNNDYDSLKNWILATGEDSNSHNVNPFFTSNLTPAINQILLNNTAVPYSGITIDIDSTVRNASNPDIGAKEYNPCSLDVGINEITGIKNPISSGIHTIKVILQNQGTTTLTSADIYWKVNGVSQTTLNWTGSLSASSNLEVSIGTYNFSSGGIYNIKAWTSSPNGQTDCDNYNDTAILTNLSSALCGIYTIGGTNPDFQSFSASAIVLNSAGITCPVTFKVRNGTYNEQIKIEDIIGTDSLNTITYESENGDSSLAKIAYFPYNSIVDYTIFLDGTKYITFQKLGIKRGSNDVAILIDNKAKNINFNSCQIAAANDSRKAIYVPEDSRTKSLTIRNNRIDSGKIETNNCTNVDIINNLAAGQISSNEDSILTIRNNSGFFDKISVNFGKTVIIDSNEFSGNIYCLGSNNVSIRKNKVTGYIYSFLGHSIIIEDNSTGSSISLIDQKVAGKASKILNNIIHSPPDYGIQTSGSSVSEISGNRIIRIEDSKGIDLQSSRTLVANNFIQVQGTRSTHGIFIDADSSTIVFNSINVTGTNSQKGRAIEIAGGSNHMLKNNIFSNSGGGYAIYCSSASVSHDFNYNNYYSSGSNFGHYSGINYYSLSTWESVFIEDSNSLNINPFYTNDTVPDMNHILLNNSAIPISGISFDIDSNIRNSTDPDIGAKEYSPCILDAGINTITGLPNPLSAGIHSIKAVLQNQGTTTLTSVIIQWEVNGVAQTTINWSGSLVSEANIEVTLGSYIFLSGTNYNFKAWTATPNGQSDCDFYNDTGVLKNISILKPPLCGTYTIGGTNPDYNNFSQAVLDLNKSGITCPVTFLVRNDTFNERIMIGKVIGSDSIKTITFKSEKGDSSRAILSNNINDPLSDYTLLLDGTVYITFKNIGIVRGSGMTNIEITNSANNINISNCYLLTAGSYNNAIMTPENSTVSNLTISHNHIKRGKLDIRSCSDLIISSNYIEGEIFGFDDSNAIITANYGLFNRISMNANKSTLIDKNTFNGNIFCNKVSIVTISNNSISGYIDCYEGNNAIIKNNVVGSSITIFDHNTPGTESKILNNIITSPSSYGIQVTGSKISEISGNRITHVINDKGIEINSSYTLVANNFIQAEGFGTTHGIFVGKNADRVNIVFNSINITGTNPTNGRAIEVDGGTNLTVKNNIFSNPGGGYAAYISTSVSGHIWDYNDYYSSTDKIGFYNNTTYNNLNNWGTAINGDANSKALNPFYASITDLTPHQRSLNGAAVPFSTVTLDIDGQLRNNIAPDIGADEFKIDFGITELYGPTLNCFHGKNDSIIIRIKQFGDLPYTNLGLAYQVNNGKIYYDTLSSVENDIIHTFDSAQDLSANGTYNFKIWLLNVNDDNINNDTLKVTRYNNTNPEIDTFTFITQCGGIEVPFIASASISKGTITGYEWLFGDGDVSQLQYPVHTYDSSGIYHVTLRAYSDVGCYNDSVRAVEIIPTPTANFSANIGCPDKQTNFLNTTIGTGTINYLWQFDDGNTSAVTDPIHTYSSPDTYFVKLVASNSKGCIDSITKKIIVRPTPKTDFLINDSTQCFSSNNFIFTNNSSISSGGVSFYWELGDGYTSSAADLITHHYSIDGTFNVKLVATSNYGCQDSVIKNVYVLKLPEADFSINKDTQCISNNIFIFINISTSCDSVLSYNWDLDSNGTFTDTSGYSISTSFNDTGIFYIGLQIITNFDTITIYKTVTIDPIPSVDFIINDSSQCFGGNSFVFTNKSSFLSGNLTYQWTFGDGNSSVLTNPSHSYLNSDTFDVKLVATSQSGCSDSITKQTYVHIHPPPVADFLINDTTQCLFGNNFIFTNNTTISSGTLTFVWSFDDGDSSTLKNPSHSYSTDDTFSIRLTAISDWGCKDRLLKSIYVHPMPIADFSINNSTQCFTRNNFIFTDSSRINTGSIMTYDWDMGNGFSYSTSNVNHSYSVINAYNVKLRVSSDNGCKDSTSKNVYVLPSPIADFVIDDSMQCLGGNDFIFTNTSVDSSGTLLYLWDFGDGTTASTQHSTHIYSKYDTFPVKLVVSIDKGCKDSIIKYTYVYTSADADFEFTNPCAGDSTLFINTSTALGDSIINFLWDFGDGKQAIVWGNLRHLYDSAGTYTVRLIALTNSICKDTALKSITVYSKPTINLTFDNDTILTKGEELTVMVIGIFDSIIWSTNEFGNSIIITDSNNYSVTVVDSHSCRNERNFMVLITEAPDSFKVTNIITPNGDEINDKWKIFNIEAYSPCQVNIYNRWGNEIYSESYYKNDWNGTRNGENLPEGTYYYVIKINDGTVYKGFVTIIR